MNQKPNRTAASGHYKVAVVEAATDKVVWEMPDWKPNLILTSGMNKKADLPWEDLFSYAVAGSGTTAQYISTGPTEWNQYLLDVYSDGVGYVDLSAGSIAPGDTLVWNASTGIERCIVAIASGTSFLVDPSLVMAAGPVGNTYIAKASRTALDAELKRTNTWFTGWPYCGTVIEGPVVKMRRTFNFGVETAQTTYGELGFTWSDNPAEPLFSRVVLDAPVTVDSGYYLRAFYELQVDHFPDVPSLISVPITPITSSAYMCIQSFAGTCTSYVATNGSSSGTPLVEGLEKNQTQWAFISDSQAELQSFGTHTFPMVDGPTIAKKQTTKEPYRDKSFFFVRAATFEPGDFVGLARLYGMSGAGIYASWDQYYVGMKLLPDTPEAWMDVTASDQVLVRWSYSWARIFSDQP